MNIHARSGSATAGGTFFLDGIVGEEFSAETVRSMLEQAGGRDVTFVLNSGGGVAFEGFAIFDAMSTYSGHVTARVILAASAASVIAMAANEIVMTTGSMMMIHDPSAMTYGTEAAHRRNADVLGRMADQCAAIYARRCGKPVETVRRMMTEETWFTADEAVTAGFADRAESTGEPVAFSQFNWRLYRHAPITLLQQKEHIRMQSHATSPAPVALPAPPPAATGNADLSIKEFLGEVRLLAGAAGLPDSAVGVVMKSAKARTPDAIKDAIVEYLMSRQSPDTIASGHVTDDTFDNPSFTRKAMGDALYARLSGRAPEGAAREMMGLSVIEMGERLVGERPRRASSVNDRLSFVMQHTTSDLPGLFGGAGQRVLLDVYKAMQSPLSRIARERDAQDFRQISLLRPGEHPELLEVAESGEVTHGTMAESDEKLKLATFGRIISVTRQALINDDLNGVGEMLRTQGQAAANVEAKKLSGLLTAGNGAGAALADGNPLFHTSRGNIANAFVAINITSLSVGRQAVRDMKGLDGVTPLAIPPRYIVCGSEYETVAEQIVASITATKAEDVNPIKLEVLCEPRLNGTGWSLFADPTMAEVMSRAYLAGNRGPLLEQKEGWERLGMEFRTIFDFGCAVTGWRGAYHVPKPAE